MRIEVQVMWNQLVFIVLSTIIMIVGAEQVMWNQLVLIVLSTIIMIVGAEQVKWN